jgi:hypothetical protein
MAENWKVPVNGLESLEMGICDQFRTAKKMVTTEL